MTIALAVAYLQLLFTTPVCQCLPSYHAEPKCSRPHSSEDTMRDRFDRLLFASCSQMKMVGGQINVNDTYDSYACWKPCAGITK